MPELPEVEILARRLRPLLRGKSIRSVKVCRPRAVRPHSPEEIQKALSGATFQGLSRRGKYLLFQLAKSGENFAVLGHLGMSGRMFVAPANQPLPKHAAVVLDLGDRNFIYEDPRYFGRMALDLRPIDALGPEPLDRKFTPATLAAKLKHSRQAIKIKLLDQTTVAGIGNIYASEALFRAGISPRLPANRLASARIGKLCRAIRDVLNGAIEFGSTVPIKPMSGKWGALFYFSDDGDGFYEERLRVYGRAGQPCCKCGGKIRRITQGGRSTFHCPRCQKA